MKLIFAILVLLFSFSMSGCSEDKKENPFLPPPETERVTEQGKYRGLTNGDRPTWYFSRTMKNYPIKFYLVIPGCHEGFFVSNNGTRYEGNGWIVKQSDVSGRGMSVIPQRKGCMSDKAHIVFAQLKK